MSFFTKVAISLLLAKVACANLAAKYSDVNSITFLSSKILIMIMISSNFIFNLFDFCIIFSFFLLNY